MKTSHDLLCELFEVIIPRQTEIRNTYYETHEIQVDFFEESFTPGCEGWREYARLDRRARHLIRKLK